MQGATAIIAHLSVTFFRIFIVLPVLIVNPLQGLPFQTVAHQIVTIDCQPTSANGILVFVCGNLKVDQEANLVKYSQCFVLLPTAAGGWYVQNGELAL